MPKRGENIYKRKDAGVKEEFGILLERRGNLIGPYMAKVTGK